MGAPEATDEAVIARFTEWFARTPTAFEFRELFVTDRRLLGTIVGESFKAALLRADTGANGRRELDGRSPAEIAAGDDCDIAVALPALRSIHLRRGSAFRRARLTLRWDDGGGSGGSLVLYNTSEGDEQAALVAALADDDRLAGVDVSVQSPRFGLF